jgi:hypothetical protein
VSAGRLKVAVATVEAGPATVSVPVSADHNAFRIATTDPAPLPPQAASALAPWVALAPSVSATQASPFAVALSATTSPSAETSEAGVSRRRARIMPPTGLATATASSVYSVPAPPPPPVPPVTGRGVVAETATALPLPSSKARPPSGTKLAGVSILVVI